MAWTRRVRREPLFAFAILGGLAYLLWSLFAPSPIETIFIDPDTLRLLESQREELLGRPLRAEERASIREGLIEDEILLREARRRELDRIDPRARERLLRAMRAALEQPLPEPTREELERYFDARIDRYWERELLELDHVFFPHGSRAAPDDPQAFTERLEREEFEPPEDSSLGLRETRTATAREIRSVQGGAFAAEVTGLPVGVWRGPIESPAGIHYFKLIERTSVPRPVFDKLASYVRQDWEIDRLREDRRRGIAAFEGNYRVVLPEE